MSDDGVIVIIAPIEKLNGRDQNVDGEYVHGLLGVDEQQPGRSDDEQDTGGCDRSEATQRDA